MRWFVASVLAATTLFVAGDVVAENIKNCTGDCKGVNPAANNTDAPSDACSQAAD